MLEMVDLSQRMPISILVCALSIKSERSIAVAHQFVDMPDTEQEICIKRHARQRGPIGIECVAERSRFLQSMAELYLDRAITRVGRQMRTIMRRGIKPVARVACPISLQPRRLHGLRSLLAHQCRLQT